MKTRRELSDLHILFIVINDNQKRTNQSLVINKISQEEIDLYIPLIGNKQEIIYNTIKKGINLHIFLSLRNSQQKTAAGSDAQGDSTSTSSD